MNQAPFKRANWAAIATGLVLFAVIVTLAVGELERRASRSAVTEAKAVARNDAAILAASLQAELDKFAIAPLVLAGDPEVHAALAGRGAGPGSLDARFEALADQTKAAAIYLMNADGLTIAASNWRRPESFVGSNYRFRRYFTEAMRNGSATQFALGTVSREPGLYIAQAVRDEHGIVGIVAVKVEFGALEKSWRDATPGVFVTDRDGVILITSNERWRFHTTRPDLAAHRDTAFDRQQFGISRLERFEPASASPPGLAAVPLVESDQPIAVPGWRLHLLVDPSDRIAAAVGNLRFYLLLGAAGLAALVVALAILRVRREARAERLVAGRTHELREQLSQANRLALLGQITAGIGHEINQPVAAARVFAENGVQLLDRGRVDEARTNFGRIVGMAERIGVITDELRRFGRRSSGDPRVMPVGQAIDGALLLLHDRLLRSGATLDLPPEKLRETLVRSEPVRLEQVLVNVLQNALDVVGPDGRITIALDVDDASCHLAVQDDGPGIAEIGDRLFHPFATTKRDGLGLGLVISRDIMRDLGGELSAEPSERGARFVMRIPRG